MDNELLEKARKLANNNFIVRVTKDQTSSGDPLYMAKNPQLPGCMAQGDTIEEAIESLDDARIDYIYSLLEDGLHVPNPALVKTTTSRTAGSFTSLPSGSFSIVSNSMVDPELVDEEDTLYEAFFQAEVIVHD